MKVLYLLIPTLMSVGSSYAMLTNVSRYFFNSNLIFSRTFCEKIVNRKTEAIVPSLQNRKAGVYLDFFEEFKRFKEHSYNEDARKWKGEKYNFGGSLLVAAGTIMYLYDGHVSDTHQPPKSGSESIRKLKGVSRSILRALRLKQLKESDESQPVEKQTIWGMLAPYFVNIGVSMKAYGHLRMNNILAGMTEGMQE